MYINICHLGGPCTCQWHRTQGDSYFALMQYSREADDKLKLLDNLDPYESNIHGTRLVLQDGGNTNITSLATPTTNGLLANNNETQEIGLQTDWLSLSSI